MFKFPVFLVNSPKPPDEIAKSFSLLDYVLMVADFSRNQAYSKAINSQVKGKVFLEVGPGPYLFLSRKCLRAGAKRVWAYEINPRAEKRARAIIGRKGTNDRLMLKNQDIFDAVPPVEIDGVVQEIFGSISSAEGVISIIDHIKAKYTGRSLVFIPRSSTSYIQPVSWGALARLSLCFTRWLSQRRNKGRPSSIPIYKCYGHGGGRYFLPAQVFENFVFDRPLNLRQNNNWKWKVPCDFWFSGFLFHIDLGFDENTSLSSAGGFSNWSNPYVEIFKEPMRLPKNSEINLETEVRLSRKKTNYRLSGYVRDIQTKVEFPFDIGWSGI